MERDIERAVQIWETLPDFGEMNAEDGIDQIAFALAQERKETLESMEVELLLNALHEIKDCLHSSHCKIPGLVGPEECGCNPPSAVATKAISAFNELRRRLK